jgi:hypothetical protein
MNCLSQPERRALELVDVVDFKWLMAHEGHHVNAERLQIDREYACTCIGLATASPVDALRRVAHRLSNQLARADA